MTDAEIAQDLERVFAEMPGMRRCYEEWKRIGAKFLAAERWEPLSEVQAQRRFHLLLSQTERRVLAAQARARIGLAEEALVPNIGIAPFPSVQVSIPPHLYYEEQGNQPRKAAPIHREEPRPTPAPPAPQPPLWERPENQGQL